MSTVQPQVAERFVRQALVPGGDFENILSRRDGLQILRFTSDACASHVFHRGQRELIPRILGFGAPGVAFLDSALQRCGLKELLPESVDLLETVSGDAKV